MTDTSGTDCTSLQAVSDTEAPDTAAPSIHPALAFLFEPIDIASMVMYRILFGLMMFGGLVRFVWSGWLQKQFIEPTFFFKYMGFSWVQPWSDLGMYLHFCVLMGLALCIAAGLFFRPAMVLFTLGFAYIQLIDVTNYLNHYYFVVLMGGLMSLLPLGSAWSLDVWRQDVWRRYVWRQDVQHTPSIRRETVPAWMLYLLRFQVAVLYFSAAMAKVGTDWLVHAHPLTLWMRARNELPLIGPLLDEPWTPYLMSWGGFVYDATIVLFLLWSRTRLLAYGAVLGFHFLTSIFFNIGMFPAIMIVTTLLFFPPDWPRAWLARLKGVWPGVEASTRWHEHTGMKSHPHPALSRTRERVAEGRVRVVDPEGLMPARTSPKPWSLMSPPPPSTQRVRIGLALFVVYAVFQLGFPHRQLLYPGDVLWHEQGMRWSFRVMVREKSGSVTYHVSSKQAGRTWQVSPHRYLSRRQAQEMSGQPDLILQLAHHIAEDFRRRGIQDVHVRAEAHVSLNGRPPALLIDPTVDLAQQEDGMGVAPWILRAPTTLPPGSQRSETRGINPSSLARGTR